MTVTYSFRADATQHEYAIETLTLTDGGYRVSERNCTDAEDGNISCVHKIVQSVPDQPLTTLYDVTYGGPKSAWHTIENVETYDIPRATSSAGEDDDDDDEDDDKSNDDDDDDSGASGKILGFVALAVGVAPGLLAGVALL
ncbi:hypothetical protein CC2G_003437 [Coprinopsis cinerea AmutBmut pab1-1]|nr:hypothetical protein CC2G_003437 [Coprinopsis cinerea AmutBmut pab1-1]